MDNYGDCGRNDRQSRCGLRGRSVVTAGTEFMDNYFIATVAIMRDRSAVDYEDKLSTQPRTKFMDVTIITILRDKKSRGYTNNKPVNYSPSAEIENKPGQKHQKRQTDHTQR